MNKLHENIKIKNLDCDVHVLEHVVQTYTTPMPVYMYLSTCNNDCSIPVWLNKEEPWLEWGKVAVGWGCIHV